MSNTEYITAAALCLHGQVVDLPPPARHGDLFREAERIDLEGYWVRSEQGFITSKGRFVHREEAMNIAREAKQLLNPDLNHRELYTEDLW